MSVLIPLNISIQPQPTNSTCGPTCLHSIYSYYGDNIELTKVIDEIPELEGGGTLGVQLGIHALNRGYDVTIYSHNLWVFDPTWFSLSAEDKIDKLKQQAIAKPTSAKMIRASKVYKEFLALGGEIKFEPLSPDFLFKYLDKKCPLLSGLSATYLYKTAREYGDDCVFDDIKGEPQGHFVVLTGISQDQSRVSLADPHEHHPVAESQHYDVDTYELINSILIGVITYDANIIVIKKQKES